MSGNVNRGWTVTLAGTGVNLALGLLYAWSIMAVYLRDNLGWTAMETQIPYMIACGVFALLMVPGGRIQDKIGPKAVIMASGVFAGIGLIASSFFMTVVGLSIFFGIFFGTAMGLGYASATPPAIKWFSPKKRGMIAGIVVAGFGLAAIYAAPAAEFMIAAYGISNTFLIIGIAFFIVITLLAQLIRNPPPGYVPADMPVLDKSEQEAQKKKAVKVDFTWNEMVRTPRFYLIWLMFCFGSLSGLMIIGQLSGIAVEQAGVTLGFILVALLAGFNAGGRVAGGVLSDKLGRANTLLFIFLLQAVTFLLFGTFTSLVPLIIGTAIAGFCYGAFLAVFPATTADFFGTKNLGVNYGLVFTSWGAGGVFGGLIGGMVRDTTGSYVMAYIIAASLCLIGAILSFFIRPKKQAEIDSPKELEVPAGSVPGAGECGKKAA